MDSSDSQGGFFSRLWRIVPSLRHPLPNPGKYEDYEQEARNIFSIANEAVDGFKFDLHRGLSPVFLVSHNITLGSSHAPGGTYEFGANYAANNAVLVSKIDTAGNLQARVQHTPSSQAVIMYQAALLNAPHTSSCGVEASYRGSDWSGVASIGTNGRYVATYLQSLTQHLAVGGALDVQSRFPGHPGGASAYTACVRYNAQNWVAAAQLASYGRLSMSYVHRVRDNCHLASELQLALAPGKIDSLASVGMEYRLKTGTFRSYITSQGHGVAHLEKKINPECTLVISGDIDTKKDEHRFGVGLVVGQ